MLNHLVNMSRGVFVLTIGMSLFMTLPVSANEVNVYSYRKPQLIQPIFDQFTKETGITVNTIYAKKGMLERIRNEGINSPADLIFTVDIGRLTDIKNAGLTRAIEVSGLTAKIPENFLDPEGHWIGLTSRARIIVASKDRVTLDEISRYEDLAEEKFKGRVCARSGKHPYMIALVASFVSAQGIEKARNWLRGLKKNLARKPQGNDRAQVKAIYNGVCDVAVINHYYMSMMLKKDSQRFWAESVRVVFPNQSDRGTHMNVSGVALAKHSPNYANALRLIDFLASENGQAFYAEKNSEYPVLPGVSWNNLQRSWGEFKQDNLALATIASYREMAIKLVDEVGFNN